MQTEYDLTPREVTLQMQRLLDAASLSIAERIHSIGYNPRYIGLFMVVGYNGATLKLLVSHRKLYRTSTTFLRDEINKSIQRAHKNQRARRREANQINLEYLQQRRREAVS